MAQTDSLKRLGGGRWETRDGRFQIEPQSGTWVIVDTTQTNEFGLPLVRGPYPSLGAAKDAIEATRTEGPAESPLADRIERVRASAPAQSSQRPAARPKPADRSAKATTTKAAAPPEPEPPPEPGWLRALHAGDRRRARELIARLEALGIGMAEEVARAEIVDDQPALARLALERRLAAAAGSDHRARAAVQAAIDAMLEGTDDDLDVEWRLVDGRGRVIRKLDAGE